ncbi:IS1/IS1595 family N-terminal zinc-binding domain-containing protein [Hymenobacter nivis]
MPVKRRTDYHLHLYSYSRTRHYRHGRATDGTQRYLCTAYRRTFQLH